MHNGLIFIFIWVLLINTYRFENRLNSNYFVILCFFSECWREDNQVTRNISSMSFNLFSPLVFVFFDAAQSLKPDTNDTDYYFGGYYFGRYSNCIANLICSFVKTIVWTGRHFVGDFFPDWRLCKLG